MDFIQETLLNRKLWNIIRPNMSRLLIGLVIIMNLQCAFDFLINPERFAPSFQLGNTPGIAAIQGFGILFMMWSVPYIIALINPVKFRMSLIQSVIMQAIGLVGETYIFLTLPDGFPSLSSSILRFIIFDGGGLIALVLALIISIKGVNLTSS